MTSAADKRKQRGSSLANIDAALRQHFPALDPKSNPRYFVEQLMKAGRLVEWNNAMASFVVWALRRAVPAEQITAADPENGEARWRVILGRLEFALAQGFVGSDGRAPDRLNAEYDAMILRANGAGLHGGSKAAGTAAERTMTIAEAANILMEWDEDKAATKGEDEAATEVEKRELARKRDRARKRAYAAEKLGVVLTRSGSSPL